MQERRKNYSRAALTQPRDYTMFGNRRVVFVIIAIRIFLLSLCVARQLRVVSLWLLRGKSVCRVANAFFMLFPMYEI